ncbi:MAG: hypothetical protein R2795_19135 [Saprospiraceae bacterium]
MQRLREKIDQAGGIDIQLLGIGRTGHIGFNEPGSWQNSFTRLVRLDGITRQDAIKDFIHIEDVPYRAITMGIGSIMKARKIFLMGWGTTQGNHYTACSRRRDHACDSSNFLQEHPNVRVYIDEAASGN